MSDRAGLRVLDAGPFATIQDLGRHGCQRFGVSPAGAADPACLRLANALVGNPDREAAIEFTLSGGLYECMAESCRIAVTGAETHVSIDGQPAERYRAYRLSRNSRLGIGAARAGLRGYVAIEGGFDLPSVLGSRATHTRSAMGGYEGRTLRAGDFLPLHRMHASNRPPLCLKPALQPPLTGPIRVVFGPQEGHFDPAARRTLLTESYSVSPRSDRMACRLDGPAIAHRADFNLISDGTVDGSIQVTGTGTPLVLLADRQTTGGYPKIATVIAPDVRLVAQRRPGETIRFTAVSVKEAERETIRQAGIDEDRIAQLETAAASPGTGPAALLSNNLISGVVGDF